MTTAEPPIVPDHDLSPHTGYTREHWIDLTSRIVRGIMPYVELDTGIPRLAGDPGETALPAQLRNPGGVAEAFSRSFMAVAAYVAATGRTRVDGYPHDIADVYRRGIATFSDPASDHFDWRRGLTGTIEAILLAPDHFLDALDPVVRALLLDHCEQFTRRPTRDANLLLFRMLPATLLERCDVDYDRDALDGDFDAILSMYRGDGWFIDGWNRGFDHYNFWGFQFYLHLFMRWVPRWREHYADRVREITEAHERTLPYCFGRDGAPIPKGRSLNYRFAVVSGIGYAQHSGLSSLDPGQARRMASGCLRYFRERGCLSERGLLEPGYLGPNAAVGEDYTDRGAPYWAATALAPLALPADHAFWTATEQPIAADTPGIKRCLVRGAEMLLKVDGDRGEARMITVGEPFYHRRVWQAGSKYYQHAYSSTLGHALAGDLGPELAAGRTGMSDDGQRWAYRTWPRVLHLDARRARSEWDAWSAIEGMTSSVVTDSLVLDQGEVHVFWHTAPEPRYLRIGGYSAQVAHTEQPRLVAGDDRLQVASQSQWSAMGVLAGPPGRIEAMNVEPRPGFRHAHLLGGWSVYPCWTSGEPLPARTPVAVWVDAGTRAAAAEPDWPELTVTQAPDAWTIASPGEADTIAFAEGGTGAPQR